MQERLGQLLKRPFQYHDSVGSTNDLAQQWLREGADAGAVVIADEQLSGRGRMGRAWQTPAGGQAIAMSVILKPDASHAGRISQMAAVCIAQVCEALAIAEVGIKWPNDVQISGKKVCGVLPEAIWQDGRLLGVVLGMGVNVRVTFDESLRDIATNIETAAGRTIDRAELIRDILLRVDYWSVQLGSDALHQAWKQRLTTLGQQVSIGDISGQAVDVEASGALLIETAQGQRQRVVAGDIM
jgi:BirA family transcriptional regulator, biotin operon repressor / biotin---[acetyl-CoA-carboxylase] ligase